MKINPTPLNAPNNPAIPPRLPLRRFAEALDKAETPEVKGLSFADDESPFAGALAQIHERPHEEQRGNQSFSDNDSRQNSDDEAKARQSDDNDKADQAGRLAKNNSPQREISPVRESAPPPVRAILHITDIERIVALCRVNNIASGQQVTLQLPNSIFAGLRVKITSDRAGGITTEFLAAQESVRLQLEARSGELAAVLRNRGLKLVEVKTTLDTAFSDREDNSGGNNSPRLLNSRVAKRQDAPEITEPAEIPELEVTANTYLA